MKRRNCAGVRVNQSNGGQRGKKLKSNYQDRSWIGLRLYIHGPTEIIQHFVFIIYTNNHNNITLPNVI